MFFKDSQPYDPTLFDTMRSEKDNPGESTRCYFSGAIEDIRSFNGITKEQAIELMAKIKFKMENPYKVEDKVNYRRATGYSEPGVVIKIQGSLVTVKTEDFDKVTVHYANSFEAGSKDWIEPAK